MSAQPENPPAFAQTDLAFEVRGAMAGMTLRDWFAGQALSAIIERHQIACQSGLEDDGEPMPEDTRAGWTEQDNWQQASEAAYAVADAMLAARSEKTNP